MKKIRNSSKEKIVTGINGFGRVGLHLLKYWLDRTESSNFKIDFINDDFLPIHQSLRIINFDKYVKFTPYQISLEDEKLVIQKPGGQKYKILYTNSEKTKIPWLGKPKIIFECSGKNANKDDCQEYLIGDTNLVMISATSWDCDKTLLYGFNHKDFNNKLKIISYGSCTVNAYVPLSNYLNKKYQIIDSDVNFVHNIPEYILENGFDTLKRKFCTLEKSGPKLLPFLKKNNFMVNYTTVPYSGVSTLDFRFRLRRKVRQNDLIKDLERAFSRGELKSLYKFEEIDTGPEAYICSPYSAVFIKDCLQILNDNVYMFGYFDTENSVNRYYDLANYISGQL